MNTMVNFEAGADAFASEDYAKAMEEWQKAADAGDAEALYNLGLVHGNGRGVEQDFNTAYGFFAKAAESSHTEA